MLHVQLYKAQRREAVALHGCAYTGPNARLLPDRRSHEKGWPLVVYMRMRNRGILHQQRPSVAC